MAKFKIGDKVIGNERASYRYVITCTGYVGTVTRIDGNKITLDHNYIVDTEAFDLYTEHVVRIEITQDNRKVVARKIRGDKVIAKASVNCNPEDEFDFDTGAKLAIERLFATSNETNETNDVWDNFIAGKIQVQVNRDNICEFLEKCEKRGLMWKDDTPASKMNPFINYDNFDEEGKFLAFLFDAVPKENIFIIYKNNALVWDNDKCDNLEVHVFK